MRTAPKFPPPAQPSSRDTTASSASPPSCGAAMPNTAGVKHNSPFSLLHGSSQEIMTLALLSLTTYRPRAWPFLITPLLPRAPPPSSRQDCYKVSSPHGSPSICLSVLQGLVFTAEAMHFFHRGNQIMLCLCNISQRLPTSFWVRAKLYHNLQSLTTLAWGPIPMLRAGRLPHTQAILGHKLSVLQLNSTLTLPIQRQHRIPKAEGSILQTATPTNFRRQFQVQVVTYTSDQLAVDPRLPQFLPGAWPIW